ncbi:MAG: transglutaminase domain-containing protein [Lachnospiraceae bacterium]|nr:transglutaminase domain-containing protein [Lachnospiraceae bacterium]
MKKFTKVAIGVVAACTLLLSGYGLLCVTGAGESKAVVYVPEASGELVKKNDSMIIDYSNATKGYVMVRYLQETESKLKAQVKGPEGTTYTYTLTPKKWAAFPLSEGNGKYKISVFRNVSGNSYATVGSKSIDVELEDELLPFLTANQYVDYTEDTKCVVQAEKTCKGLEGELAKVDAIYKWTMKKFSYSTMKAKKVESGYVPDLDAVYKSRKAICFDYASTMVAMLRSQGVPTKLVIGYSGSVYHAWISVYIEESGWVTGIVYFDGENWSLMDPTFADTAKSEEEFKEYIGDATNYTQKYVY